MQLWRCQNDSTPHITVVSSVERERKELRRVARSTELKEILGERPSAMAAIRMILSTKLLDQFQATGMPALKGKEADLGT